MSTPETPASFEHAMERLEAIVEQMESGNLPLEDILARYEEGNRLVRHCTEQLSAAGKRIEIITQNASGAPEVSEFDPEAAPEPEAEAPRKPRSSGSRKPAAESSGEVSLF